MKKILIILLFFVCFKVKASIAVMDASSGRILYQNNMNEKKLIASTSKIMTAIIALENAPVNIKYKIGNEIDEAYGSMAYLKKNDELTLNDLLYALMLRSGNDAALTIANNVLKYDEFIAQMNIKAFNLGMNNTFYENPHGLNETTKNYSTAYDLCLLMKYAIKNKDFLKITSTKKYKVDNYVWYNKNDLLSDYKYLISGKIGYTKASGQVFVSAATKDNKTLIIASIDEDDKFNLHKKLYQKYFELYKKYRILDKNFFSFGMDNKENNYYYINNNFDMLLTDEEKKLIKVKINLNDDYNFVNIYLNDEFIHKEKIYVYEYKKRINKLKELLLFKN